MARLTFLLFALLLIPLNNAQAIEINQQGAEKLKSSFQALLDYQKTVNDALGSVRIEYKGDLKVTQESTYYSATFPHIFIKGPHIDGVPDDDTAFDMGVIRINAIPDEKPGYWKTVITLPSKMTLAGATPEEDFSVSFSDQQSIALFSETLGYFTKVDINISDIAFQAAGQDVGINIGGMQIYMKLEDQGNNTFSGPGHVLISSLDISPPEEKETVLIGELKADFSMQDFKMPTLKEYQDKIVKHAKTYNSIQGLEQDDNVKAVNGSDIVDMIIDLYDFDMNGLAVQYSTKDISINSNMENKSRDFDKLHIGSASFGLGFEDIKSESGSMIIKGGYNNINMSPADPEYKDVIPQNMNLNIKALNIPYGVLTKVATNTARAIATDPNSAQMAGLGVLMRLPAILSQAGTQVSVDKNGAKNSTYDFTIDGKLLTDLSAMSGFTAQFNAVFEGLDALLSIVKKNASNKDSKNASSFTQMATSLENLKTAGKAQKGPNGKPAYSYDIQATADGKFLVNGQDANTVFSPPPQ